MGFSQADKRLLWGHWWPRVKKPFFWSLIDLGRHEGDMGVGCVVLGEVLDGAIGGLS